MAGRPKIKLELTRSDKILEIMGGGLIFAIWVLVLVSYPSLPESIPTHYNGTGEADAFGSKSSILGLPLVATALFIGLSILNQYPHTFNYPDKIIEENARYQYRNSTRMLRCLKLVILIIFGMATYLTIRNAHQETAQIGKWFLPLTLGLIFIPVICFLIRAYRGDSKN
ncbi:DUF1648 domain-containing protein [Moheibacter sp.]|uniref:DUF1648 domain-containing protein n=1 Tax=Moheibacter sp. TaxID=1965316 RepID=UPI003C76D0CF